jgi:outer membrane protein assembly factor BamA
VEASASLDLDVRDNANLPTRGARLFVSHHNGIITNNDNSNYGQTLVFIEHFSSKRILLPFTLGLKIGGGDSYGEIPFYKQFALGQNTFLRGFRNNRFTGAAIAFFNSELRMKLFVLHTQIVPMQFGMKGFFDSGQIVEDKLNFKNWHKGYGFGFFIIPLEARFALNASVGFSDEETVLLRFGLGTTFK